MLSSSRWKTVSTGILLFALGIGFYFGLKELVDFDLDWSVSLADLYCKKSKWVRKSTLPLTSIVRTSVCITETVQKEQAYQCHLYKRAVYEQTIISELLEAYGLFHDKSYTKSKGNIAVNIAAAVLGEMLLGMCSTVIKKKLINFNQEKVLRKNV